MSFKNVDVAALKTDLVKNAVIIVMSRLIRYYLLEHSSMGSMGSIGNALPTDFVYGLVFTLLSFVFFHLVVNPQLRKSV